MSLLATGFHLGMLWCFFSIFISADYLYTTQDLHLMLQGCYMLPDQVLVLDGWLVMGLGGVTKGITFLFIKGSHLTLLWLISENGDLFTFPQTNVYDNYRTELIVRFIFVILLYFSTAKFVWTFRYHMFVFWLAHLWISIICRRLRRMCQQHLVQKKWFRWNASPLISSGLPHLWLVCGRDVGLVFHMSLVYLHPWLLNTWCKRYINSGTGHQVYSKLTYLDTKRVIIPNAPSKLRYPFQTHTVNDYDDDWVVTTLEPGWFTVYHNYTCCIAFLQQTKMKYM